MRETDSQRLCYTIYCFFLQSGGVKRVQFYIWDMDCTGESLCYTCSAPSKNCHPVRLFKRQHKQSLYASQQAIEVKNGVFYTQARYTLSLPLEKCVCHHMGNLKYGYKIIFTSEPNSEQLDQKNAERIP